MNWICKKCAKLSGISALSVLGVVATLITLAVGPFFQQSIAFYSARSIDYDIPAYASTARTYTSNLSNPNNGPAAYGMFWGPSCATPHRSN